MAENDLFRINENNPEYWWFRRRQEKDIILLVNGYGCHFDSPLGWIYLPEVVRFIDENFYRIRLVIPLGGFTQRETAPGISEAGLMAEYLRARCKNIPLILVEDGSYTTYGNSQKGAEKIEENGPIDKSKTIIVHFCEATRAANVVMLDRHFLLHLVQTIDDIIVRTASWEKANPFKQVGNLIYNKLAISFPWLGLAERELRRRVLKAERA